MQVWPNGRDIKAGNLSVSCVEKQKALEIKKE